MLNLLCLLWFIVCMITSFKNETEFYHHNVNSILMLQYQRLNGKGNLIIVMGMAQIV